MTIDEYAREASLACSRWYGRQQRWNAPKGATPWVPCAEWFKEHWRRFPRTSPDGGKIIDHAATGLVGFGGDEARR